MNAMSDKLKQKLPPTDSRLRPDLRNWEQANLSDATYHQERLETNQRTRRALLKEKFKNDPDIKITDERTFYKPQYFDKVVEIDDNGNKTYTYKPKGNKYWEEREKGTWLNAPRIFEDGCEPFYWWI